MNFKIGAFLYFSLYLIKGELNYNIDVPEFICDKSDEQNDIKTDTTTIRVSLTFDKLQQLLINPKDKIKINKGTSIYKLALTTVMESMLDKQDYQFKLDLRSILAHHKYEGTDKLLGEGKLDFKLNFKRTSRTCRNTQRCNLMAWKVIREFEKYLNNFPYMKSNSIEFNNTMLLPGIKYILNVYVTQGNTREQKQVILNFVDDDFIKAAGKPLACITLVGVPSSEAHMIYVLHAELNICSNISDFYFHWELLDESNNLIDKFVDRSSELMIPPFTFQDEKTYIIKCNLLNMEDNEPIAKSTYSVNIKNDILVDSLVVKLPMLYTTIQVQQLVNIRPYVVDLGNQEGDIKREWMCMYNNKNVCENNDDEELNIEEGFLEEGEYNITLKLTKGSDVKTDFCIIKVLKHIPSIEIETVETPILPSTGVTIKANINDLRTFCSLQWQSEDDLFDLSDVPGNVNELYNVTVRRDLFLRELQEFSSDVTNKQFNLVIPPPSGNWPGLPNLEENYKLQFLLEVKCPNAQLQNNDIEIEYSEEMLNDTTTVTALVSIDVNVAPKLPLLEVEPSTGVALQTRFTFTIQEVLKTGAFLYKFGYLLGDREFVFYNMLGFKKATTILPYIDNGVRTFLEVCDGFSSCGKSFGPIIKTTAPEKINEENVLRIFKEKLNTEDFYKAFGYALSVIYTSKCLHEEEKYTGHFSTGVYNKIQYMLKFYSDDLNWSKRVNKLIENISDFNEELSFSELVLNGLEQLRSKLLAAQREKLILPRRQLLEVNKKTTNLANFKSYLQVSDLIITSSTDKNKIKSEKEHLRQKIMEYMGKLCVELHGRQQIVSLELKTITFVVEKLPKKSYNNFHIIPFNGDSCNISAEIKINNEALDKTGEKLCIAKTVFKDFFNKTGFSYGVNILSGNDGNLVLDNINNTLLIPVDKQQIIDKIPKCIIYNNGWESNCKFIKLVSKYAQCTCTKLGHFYVEYEDKAASATTVANDLFTDVKKVTGSTITNKDGEEVGKVITESSPARVSSTNVDEMTPKLSLNQPLTTPLITLTTGIDEDRAAVATNTVGERGSEKSSTTVDKKTDNLSPDLRTNDSTISPQSNNKNSTESPPIPTNAEISQSKLTDSSSVTTGLSTVPNLDSDSVKTREDQNVVTQSSTTLIGKVTDITIEDIPVTQPVPLASSALDEPKSKTVNSEVDIVTNVYTSTTLVSLAVTTDKSINNDLPMTENIPEREAGKSTGIADKVPSVGTPTIVQFLTLPTPIVVTKNVTNDRKPVDGLFGGGFIQGGIQANFNTGFSVNFYLNTTYK